MAADTTARRGRRLRDRLPVRLRHHWKPVATLGVGLAAMVCFLGNARISPYVTSSSRVEGDPITENVRGSVDLYDTSVSHSIQLTYQQTDFDKMMKEFRKDGTKDYIEADLVVDGVYLNDVGIRLKGNSTLSSLRGGKGMPGGGAAPPQGANGAAGAGAGAGAGGRNGGKNATGGPAGAGGMGGMGGMIQYDLSAAEPEELPWLVKIDEFVEGRAYQGEREISLRPGSNGQAPVNEALSLTLTRQSGQKAERYAFTQLKVNNRPAATRLMVESPDTDYADDVADADGDGVLYKAKAGGSFEYRGDDPTDYESSFEQLNKKGSQDLEPVMKLIKWANKASDAEFARDLGKYVDVDSLATYLATQNLLLNFDDMAGPGKNYLLWYDLDTKKFSVLGWDYNLTFSGDATAGPDDSISMGGGMPGARQPGGTATGGTADGKQGASQQPPTGGTAPSAMPSGMPQGMPEGMPDGMPSGMPQGMPSGMPQGVPGGTAGGDGQGGGPGQGLPGGKGGQGGLMGHVLKTRFLDSDQFDGVYKTAYRELYRKFYQSGTAVKALESIADQARSAGADSKELDTAVTKLRTTLTDRAAALAKDKQVTG
ncbi:spore coat protein CotH [Streptomyces sp. GMY01]|uniref:CotH kinase family protein n=1 Tax=Streptomyces sp. GMY02 TaxID=1333528 RepID=UPI00146E6BF3|nr:CotH kinase family protein [Streptomyces sp. GMY02]NMO34753.1 spore coat protein CotH [Streptomyces sp. GMY02]